MTTDTNYGPLATVKISQHHHFFLEETLLQQILNLCVRIRSIIERENREEPGGRVKTDPTSDNTI